MSNRYLIVCLNVLVLIGLLAVAVAAPAQPPTKVYRIGALGAVRPTANWRIGPAWKHFLQGLRELGYVEGHNVVIEFRSAEGKADRYPALAAEMVGLKMDVILVGTCGALLDAVRHATRTIPIVVGACTDDMVAAGIVESLAHPGGNVTGPQELVPGLAAKQLELLKEVVPGVSRVAVLWNPSYSKDAADWRNLRPAARALGVTLLPVEARGPEDYETAFSTMTRDHAQALLTTPDPAMYVYPQRLPALAASHRLPAMYPYHENADAGGLISYGASLPDLFRRSATYIDKILKGAKPGDLPVEQPTKFELVVNLKTAKALGITIPQSILVRADRVIE